MQESTRLFHHTLVGVAWRAGPHADCQTRQERQAPSQPGPASSSPCRVEAYILALT